MSDRSELPDGFLQMLKNVAENAAEKIAEDRHYDPTHFDTDAQWLARTGAAYLVQHKFEPGQIVRSKADMRTPYSIPKDGQPCVVIAYVPGQRVFKGKPSSSQWGTRVDLCVGMCASSDLFHTAWYDSGYFEPAP